MNTWKTVWLVVAGALATLTVAEFAFQSVRPARWMRVLDDGVRDLRNGDPIILSISSSHGRSMDVVARQLGERTGDPDRMISTTVPGGYARHFDEALRTRIAPLIEEVDRKGRPARSRLKHALLVTVWWDSCWYPGERPVAATTPNAYPAYVWTTRDYLADVARSGVTSHNKNFLFWKWKQVFNWSILTTDRGQALLVPAISARIRGYNSIRTMDQESDFIAWWHQLHESAAKCMLDPRQMQHYKSILDYFKSRDVPLTIVVFPQMPLTVTRAAWHNTIVPFADAMRSFATNHGAGFVDLSTVSPLTDQDFMEDYDHVNSTGNQKLARWVLDGPLAFLADDPPQPTRVPN